MFIMAAVSKLLSVTSAIWSRRKRTPRTAKRRWIDYADPKYDVKLRDDIMSILAVLVLFLPLPIFWALSDQQGSRWTFQATHMNGRVGSAVIKPDQMQVANPALILIHLPLMEYIIYPCLSRMRLLRRPLQRIATGGFLASVSFIISAFLEMKLREHYPVELTPGLAQMRIFNMAPCDLSLTSDQFQHRERPGGTGKSVVNLSPKMMHEELFLDVATKHSLKLKVSGSCVTQAELFLALKAEHSQSVYLHRRKDNSIAASPAPSFDSVQKGSDVNPTVRFIYVFVVDGPHEIRLEHESKVTLKVTTRQNVGSTDEYESVPVGEYDITVDGKVVASDKLLDVAGTYSLLVNETNASIHEVMEPNKIHMLWLLPQYMVITAAEVMFSVTGLEFSFTQAPLNMRSVLTSVWLLTVTFGNLIVVIIADAKIFDSLVWEFVLFAALMFFDMVIFVFIAMRYKYRNVLEPSRWDDTARRPRRPASSS